MHAGINVTVYVGEVYRHRSRLCRGVVAEQYLRVCYALTLIAVVGAAVYLPSITGLHAEMVLQVYAVVQQFAAYVLVKLLEIDAVAQWFLAGGIEYAIHHLVKQCLLVHVPVAHYLLHTPLCFGDSTLIRLHQQSFLHLLWAEGYGAQLKGGVYRTVIACHRVLVRLLHRPAEVVVGRLCHRAKSLALRFVHVFLKKTQRLIKLKVARCLIKCPRNRLVKLLSLHLCHLLDVRHLNPKQANE